MLDQRIAVRRANDGRDLWLVADDAHSHFENEFGRVLLANVELVHTAPPMDCAEGYDVGGEMVGDLVAHDGQVQMPADVVETKNLVYNSKARFYYQKQQGSPEIQIDRADYMLLSADGTVTAGWKTARTKPAAKKRKRSKASQAA